LIILCTISLLFPEKHEVHLLPSSLRRYKVALSVESDVGEGVTVQELNRPVQNADQALQTAQEYDSNDISILGRTLSSRRANLAQELDDSHDETSKTDAAEAVCKGSLERPSGRAFRKVVVAHKVPRAIHTGNDYVYRIFQPSRTLLVEGHLY
jgi:hypothetical protein